MDQWTERHIRTKCGQVNDKNKAFGLKSDKNFQKGRILAESRKSNVWPIISSGYQRKMLYPEF